MKILVLNAGSSSQKSKLYAIEGKPGETAPTPLWEGSADWTGRADTVEITIRTAGGKQTQSKPHAGRRAVLEDMLKTLWESPQKVVEQPSEIAIVGHRVVHGGEKLRESTRVTPEVLQEIQQLARFAPLHNPANAEGIRVCEQLFGQETPQIAVFDTAFHKHIPPEIAIYPGPYAWFEQGIRHYGFHGISHQYCARRSAQISKRDLKKLRIVNCHLGNGCSLAAIVNGHSIDTTMGFTPLDGLMMGSRSGSIDPGILTYLQREHGYTAEQIDQILNKESGLQGISGISADMRRVMQAIEEGNQRAKLALDMYIYRLRFFIGAMIATLGGIDVLTFTGGVGENAAQVRARTCAAFGFLGLKLDTSKNAASPADEEISTSDSAVRVLLVHTQEDWEIARECWSYAGTTLT